MSTTKHSQPTQDLEPPRLENGRELLLAGLNVAYTFDTRAGIPNQWERFGQHLGKFPGQMGNTSYGVCWNYQPGCGFDYLTAVEVSDVTRLPAGFTHLRLPARRYAAFAHRGHVSSIPATIDNIWTKWLPGSELKAAGAPCFERYTEQFDPKTGQGGTEIWIPLDE